MSPAQYTCPGLSMPQPSDAPFEGFLACYVAGHDCGYGTTVEESVTGSTTTARCPCCGDMKWMLSEPRSGDEFPAVSQ